MAGEIYINSDLFIDGVIKMPTVPNNSGTVLTYNPTTQTISTRLNSEFIDDLDLVTVDNAFNTVPFNFFGVGSDANTITHSGFYKTGQGSVNTGAYTGSVDGARMLLHFQTEDVYSASQIQTERYSGNLVSRSKNDGGWTGWVRHWGENDFTLTDVNNWKNLVNASGNFVTTNTDQNITGTKSFKSSGTDEYAHKLWVRSDDGSNPGMTFWNNGVISGILNLSVAGFNFVSGNTTTFIPIKTGGFKKDGSDDNYLLLGGGGHKQITDFATSAHTHSNLVPYTGATQVLQLANNNLVYTHDGSTVKVENQVVTFDNVYQAYYDAGANQGALVIKFPRLFDNTMVTVDISIYGYGSNYLGKLTVAVYIYAGGIYNGTGHRAIFETTDNFPTNQVRVGLDGNNNVCICLGDGSTQWNGHFNFTVDKLTTTYSGYNADWNKGWSHNFDDGNFTGYVSLITPVTDVVATKSFINNNLNDYWKKHISGSFIGFNSNTDFVFLNGNQSQRGLFGGLLTSDSYGDSQYIPSLGIYSKGNIKSESIIQAQGGFQTPVYVAGRNRIWSFGNSDNYGLSYQQSGFNVGGIDYGEGINFHFGDSANFKVHINLDGQIYSKIHGNSGEWNIGYLKSIVSFDNVPGNNGDVFRINMQNGLQHYTESNGHKVLDTRYATVFGTDGNADYFPNGQHVGLNNRTTSIFHTLPVYSGEWASSIVTKGWSDNYRAWRISGTSTTGDVEQEFYLNQTKSSDGTWMTDRKIWTEKHFTQTNVTNWNNLVTASGNYVTIDTPQGITGKKEFTSNGGYGINNNSLWISTNNTSYDPSITFNHGNNVKGQIKYAGLAGFRFTGEDGLSGMATLQAGGYHKAGRTDDYVLLAGGGDKPLTDFLNPSAIVGFATESWVNTYFIPKTHPVYNVTLAQINSWNDIVTNGATQTWVNTQLNGKVSQGGANYYIGWDGFENYFFRDNILQGYLWHTGNLNPNNFIPTTHPSYGINQNDINQFRKYVGYWDNRNLKPNDIVPTNLQFGFGSYSNNNTGPYGDYLHFGGYPDISGGSQNLIMFNKSGFGIRQFQKVWQDTNPYTDYVDFWNTSHFTQTNINNWNNIVQNQGNFVPYTGATQNVDLNGKNLSNINTLSAGTFLGNGFYSNNLTGGQVFNSSVDTLYVGNSGLPTLYFESSGNFIFSRSINILGDNEGVKFYEGGKIYKKGGYGVVINRGTNELNPKIESSDGSQMWDIIHSGNGNLITSGHVPYTGANQMVNLNDQNLTNVNGLWINKQIIHNTYSPSTINIAGSGYQANLLIKTGAVPGNMVTFTVKLYSYPERFYEFQVNLYHYADSHYLPTITWKSGLSNDITRIDFLKDSNNVLYVHVVVPINYGRAAITDIQGYPDSATFLQSNWNLQFNPDVTGLTLTHVKYPYVDGDFIKDYALKNHTHPISDITNLQNIIDSTTSDINNRVKKGDSTIDAIGFSGGNIDEAPYIYTSGGLFRFLATQTWVNQQGYLTNASINNVHKINPGSGITNDSNSNTNKTWFDYSWGGTGALGSVINFSGFGGADQRYSTELFGEYNSGGNRFGLRTKNGDNGGTWNPIRWIWTDGNFNPNDYVLNSGLNGILSNYVDKTSDQTINGVKKFTGYYNEWTYLDDATTYTRGFVQSQGDAFYVGTLNDKPLKLFVNANPKVTVDQSLTTFHTFVSVPNGSDNSHAINLGQLNTYNPKKLHSDAQGTTDLNNLMEDYKMRFDTAVYSNSTNIFPGALDNANGVISISTHPNYGTQLGFNTQGDMSLRPKTNGLWGQWEKMATREWIVGNNFTTQTWVNQQLVNYVDKTSDQNITGRKEFTGGTGNSYNNASIVTTGNGASVYPSIGFHHPGNYGANLSYRGNGFYFRNINDTGFDYVRAAGYIKDGSDDNYLLLGGGGHKQISDFVTTTSIPTNKKRSYFLTSPPYNTFIVQRVYLPNYNVAEVLIRVNSSYHDGLAAGLIEFDMVYGCNLQAWYAEFKCTKVFGNTQNWFYLEPIMYWDDVKQQNYFKIHKKSALINPFFVDVQIHGNSNNLTDTSVTFEVDSVSTVLNLTNVVDIYDNKYLPKTGGDMTGMINFADDVGGIMGTNGVNDTWRVIGRSTGNNGGYLELGTGDDGNEPIYARQWGGPFSSLVREAILLGSDGNTHFPGTVYSGGSPVWTSGNFNPATKWDIYSGGIYKGITTDALAFSFLKPNASASLNIYTGGVLISNDYTDSANIPANGMWVKGTISTATHGNSGQWNTAYDFVINSSFKKLRNVSNIGDVSESGIYREEGPSSGYMYTTTLNLNSSDGRQQLTIERQGGGMKFRGSNYGSGNQGWSSWKTVWDDSNLVNPATQSWVNSNTASINHTHNTLYSSPNGVVDPNSLFVGNELNLKFLSAVYENGSNMFPAQNSANSILHVSTWSDSNYGHQLGFSSNGFIYQRYKDTTGFTGWGKMLTDRDPGVMISDFSPLDLHTKQRNFTWMNGAISGGGQFTTWTGSFIAFGHGDHKSQFLVSKTEVWFRTEYGNQNSDFVQLANKTYVDNNFLSTSGGTINGNLVVNGTTNQNGPLHMTVPTMMGIWRGTNSVQNYLTWMKHDNSQVIAYLGADGGSAGSGGSGNDFVIRNPSANVQLVTDNGIVTYNGWEIATKNWVTNNTATQSWVNQNFVTLNTEQKIITNKTIGENFTQYSGWSREDIGNTQVGPFSLLNLAINSGYPIYEDDEFRYGTNGIVAYNNAGTSAINITLEAESTAPNRSGYVLKVKRNSANGATTPGLGGWIHGIPHRANAVFLQKFVAKVPVGFYLVNAENYVGDGGSVRWLTPRAGTGKYETYVRSVICGTGGGFGGGGHIYLDGPGDYEILIASSNVFELNSSIQHKFQDTISGMVPYTGANQNLNLGQYGLSTIVLNSPNLSGTQVFNASNASNLYIGNGAVPNVRFEASTQYTFHVGSGIKYWFNNSSFNTRGDINLEGLTNGDLPDIIWTDSSGAEKHRLWDGGSTLSYRYNNGTTYGLVHTGNLDASDVVTKSTQQGVTGLKVIDRVQSVGAYYGVTTDLNLYSMIYKVGQGPNTTDNRGASIGFYDAPSGGVMAGIYVKNNGQDGTHMAFATTHSYSSGPQIGMTMNNYGKVNFERTIPSFQGLDLVTQNYVDNNFISTSYTAQTKFGQLTLNSGLGLPTGQRIALKGLSDGSHYIKHFTGDDSVGFGINTKFTVKPYNDEGTNLFSVDANGTTVMTRAFINGALKFKVTVIDLTAYDPNTYYPVTLALSTSRYTKIKVYRTLDGSYGVPPYSTHGVGFMTMFEIDVLGHGWGTTDGKAYLREYKNFWVTGGTETIGYKQMNNSTQAVVYLRGGSKYDFEADIESTPVLRTSYYEIYGEVAEPTTTRIWQQFVDSRTDTLLNNFLTTDTTQYVTGQKRFRTDGIAYHQFKLEVNTNNGSYFPGISFHKEGYYAGSIQMIDPNTFAFRNNPGTDNVDFVANTGNMVNLNTDIAYVSNHIEFADQIGQGYTIGLGVGQFNNEYGLVDRNNGYSLATIENGHIKFGGKYDNFEGISFNVNNTYVGVRKENQGNHEVEIGGRVSSNGFVHDNYNDPNYLLTSDGDAKHINEFAGTTIKYASVSSGNSFTANDDRDHFNILVHDNMKLFLNNNLSSIAIGKVITIMHRNSGCVTQIWFNGNLYTSFSNNKSHKFIYTDIGWMWVDDVNNTTLL